MPDNKHSPSPGEPGRHRLFGLIGYPLSHSFSKKYFTQKFEMAGLTNCRYELFPLASLKNFQR